jgi:lipopolysaccharide heptosyltransferase II
MSTASWADAVNLLCIRLDTLGDVVMMEPALRAVKQAVRSRKITLLTSPSGASVAPLIAAVDETLIFEAPWMKASAAANGGRETSGFIERLRSRKFDAAVIFTCFSQTPFPAAMICHLAGIPLRLAHCRENPYQLLTDWAPEREPENGSRHEVQRQLDLVARIGAAVDDPRITLSVDSIDAKAALTKLRRTGFDPRQPWFAVHVGASAPSRRWPPDYFAKAADLMSRRLQVPIVFTGTAGDQELIRAVQAQMRRPSYSAAGRLNVGQMAGALAAARLLISNNTGPVHLAAGVGTPVVDLYALTNPQHTPWQVPSRVLSHDVACRNCFRSVCPEGHHRCLRGVTPEQVVSAVEDLLAETRGRAVAWTKVAS